MERETRCWGEIGRLDACDGHAFEQGYVSYIVDKRSGRFSSSSMGVWLWGVMKAVCVGLQLMSA